MRKRLIRIKFKEPTKDNLIFLESLGLTYNEMCECFELKLHKSAICKKFKRYGIKHKTIAENIACDIKEKEIENESLSKLSLYYRCHQRTVKKAKMINNDKDNNKS